MDTNNQDGTLAVTVTQTATVPLSPVVEAVIAALPKATDQQVETYVEENFQRLLDCSFDVDTYESEITSIAEEVLESNFSWHLERTFDITEHLNLDFYAEAIVELVSDSNEFVTRCDIREKDAVIEGLVRRVEQLEYALRKMGEVLSGLGGDQ